jgi:hypothetical protein
MWRATSSEPASPTSIHADCDGNADGEDAAKTYERFAHLREEIARLKAELDQKNGETKARMEQLQQRWRAEAGMKIAVERKMTTARTQQAIAERNAALGIARMDAGYWEGQCGRPQQMISEIQKKREIEETSKTAVAKPTTQAAVSQRSLDEQYYAAEELKTASSQSTISADMLQTATENMRKQQQEFRNQQGYSYDVAIRDCRIACEAALLAERAKQYSASQSKSGPVQPELAASRLISQLAGPTGNSQAIQYDPQIQVEIVKHGHDAASRERLKLLDRSPATERAMFRKNSTHVSMAEPLRQSMNSH